MGRSPKTNYRNILRTVTTKIRVLTLMEAALLGLRRSHRSIRPNFRAVGLLLASLLFLSQGAISPASADEMDDHQDGDFLNRAHLIYSTPVDQVIAVSADGLSRASRDNYAVYSKFIITEILFSIPEKVLTKHKMMANGDNVAIFNFNPCSSRDPPFVHA